MRKNFYLVVFALFSLLIFPAAAPMQMENWAESPLIQPPALEPADCVVDVPLGYMVGEDVLCYYLRVPARYETEKFFPDPNAPTLRLAVMVIRATDPNPRPDPLFFAQGGPGGSTIDLYTSYLFGSHRLTPDRDFVLLEQRGTLYAQPALYCSEYDDFVIENLNVILSDEESERLSRQALLACLERFRSDGVDLSDFNSVENARDIETLRLSLGYEQINLYGVSYGSLLAQHYMRLYPASLRTAILDGVVPAESNLYLDVIHHENRAFRYFFDACQSDALCGRHYPDLETVFYATVAQLDENPASIVLLDLDTDIQHAALLDGASLYSSAFQMLYNSTLSKLLPRIVYDAKQGDFEILSKVLSLFIFDRTMSYGMYFSVMCAEDGDFDPASIDYSGIRPEIVEFNQGGPESVLQTCQAWNVPALPVEANLPVESDVPTLLLSGGFDPVTPASNADLIALNLSTHYNITFPWGAHGQLFDNACADQIIQDFLDAPSRQPDTTCLADYQSPDFFAPRDIIMLPVTLKLLRLDASILPGLLGLLAGFFGLLSAWFFLPLAWLIGKLQTPEPNSPRLSRSLRLATPLALLNGAILAIFLVAYLVAVIASLDGDSQFLLFFGLPGVYRPIFILPLLAMALTLGMMPLSLLGWFSDAWHFLRKFYYSVLMFSALLVLLVLALSGMLFALFA